MNKSCDTRFRAKRIDCDQWVTGRYFRAPLTDENSGAPPEAGWFFLAGPDQPTRHLIEDDGVAYTVDPETLCVVEGAELLLLRAERKAAATANASWMAYAEAKQALDTYYAAHPERLEGER